MERHEYFALIGCLFDSDMRKSISLLCLVIRHFSKYTQFLDFLMKLDYTFYPHVFTEYESLSRSQLT